MGDYQARVRAGIAVARAELDDYMKLERASFPHDLPEPLSRHATLVADMLGEWDRSAARAEWRKQVSALGRKFR